MKYFEDLVIPDGIVFFDTANVNETSVGDKNSSCSCITNGGIQVDYYRGVTGIHKNCRNISCCSKCIFHKSNYEKRLKYFKELKSN